MKNLMNLIFLVFLCALGWGLMFSQQSAYSHCQIPCGIYDDHARLVSMFEDAATVEKSIKLIVELVGKNDAQSQNQLVRWVINKEKHAQNIIDTICDYFLTQRIGPTQKDYKDRLIKHHRVILDATKVKQNVEIKYLKVLKESIEALSSYYPPS